MKKFVLGLLLLWWAGPAHAQFFTHAEWARMQTHSRAMYMAGVFDNYIILLAGTDLAAANHFNRCVINSQMTTGQLAENVLHFSKANPGLHALPVTSSLVYYLEKVCGPAPKQDTKKGVGPL